jgi:hypothetical protein
MARSRLDRWTEREERKGMWKGYFNDQNKRYLEGMYFPVFHVSFMNDAFDQKEANEDVKVSSTGVRSTQ